MEQIIEVGSQIEVDIEKMSFGGSGICRIDSLVCFVSDSSPGDRLLIEITKKKKNFLEAKNLKVIEAGPHRRQAPCDHAQECGGCQWQHIAIDEQRDQKRQIFQEMLDKVDFLKEVPLGKIYSGEEFRYRNRIQVRTKNKKIGYFKKASNQIIGIKDCLITQEKLTDLFPEIIKKHLSKKLQKFEILHSKNGNVIFRKDKAHGELDGFSQVNDEMNLVMQAWVGDQVEDLKLNGEIFDLYAGNGNFSRFLEGKVDNPITAIELNPQAIYRGKALAGENSRIQWLQAKVENKVSSIKAKSNSLLIIDPPRIGCDDKFIQSLQNTGAEYLIYISCNPSTWIRDLKRLKEIRDFEVEKLELLDMFPQTYHMEVLSRIRLKK